MLAVSSNCVKNHTERSSRPLQKRIRQRGPEGSGPLQLGLGQIRSHIRKYWRFLQKPETDRQTNVWVRSRQGYQDDLVRQTSGRDSARTHHGQKGREFPRRNQYLLNA